MAYADGYVMAVPSANKAACRKHAKVIAKMFIEHGATDVVDCWGDDVPEGKLTSFPMAVKKKADEVVCLGWILWPTRATRNKGWKKAMSDPRMMSGAPGLFDGKRMIFGGFDIIQRTSMKD